VTAETDMMRLLERADPARRGDAPPLTDGAQYLEELLARDHIVPAIDLVPALDAGVDESSEEEPRVSRGQSPARPRRWSPRRIAVAAAAVVALIVGASLLVRGGDDTKTEGPADPRPTPTTETPADPRPSPTTVPPGINWNGALALVPPEETQTTPKIGELVASAGWFSPGESYSQAWYLYADGRLISVGNNSGWREQRLAADGVERVRSEFLSTGLFDAEQAPTVVPASSPAPFLCVCVRDGGQLLAAGADEAETLRLVGYFTQLELLLPAGSWLERPATEFVASRFELCITNAVSPYEAVPEPYRVLAGLSARAAELLGDRPTRALSESKPSTCCEVTTAEARALREEFVALGQFFEVTEPVSMTVNVSLDWLLPDGTPAMWGG
jgi:hypothetical protein